MKFDYIKINIEDLVKGYINSEETGTFAYDGKLNVRPSYQREFCYDEKRQKKVIISIRKGIPIDSTRIVFAEEGEGYTLFNGNQRITSICKFINNEYSISDPILKGIYYFENLPSEIKSQILNFEIEIQIIKEATYQEKKEYFEIINMEGLKVNEQEKLNAIYTGPWLESAKKYFSKTNCVAYQKGKNYLNGNPIRQEYLEKVISWKADFDGIGSRKDKANAIEQYMSNHQKDENADELWDYFLKVINWIQLNFLTYYKEMKGLEWGYLYNIYHLNNYNILELEKEVKYLMSNDEIVNKKGIFEYLLGGKKEEKLLNVRKFSDSIKRTAFEKQRELWRRTDILLGNDESVCPICNGKFKFKDMEGDHKIPWVRGGRTELDNCQMLCRKCNREKSSKGGY